MPSDSERITTVETEVGYIRETVDNVVYELKNLSRILTEQGKISWPVIIGCGTLCITSLAVMISVIAIIGNMALSPVKNDVVRIQSDQEKIEARIMERVDEKISYSERIQDAKCRQ